MRLPRTRVNKGKRKAGAKSTGPVVQPAASSPWQFAGTKGSSKDLSFWLDTTPRTDYPAMPGNVSADVAVIGGGITGLTAAVLLKRSGKTVVLIEADRIA